MDSGHGQKGRTVEETMKDHDEDDGDDGVLFPLCGPGIDWYQDKGIKFNANMARTDEQLRNTVIMEDSDIKGLVRGSATGSVTENINVLIDKLSSASSSKQQDQLSAMISIGHFIMNNGLIIPYQNLANRYKELKGLKDSTCIESARLVEVLTKQLNMIQIYIDGKGYTLENYGQEIVKIVNSLKDIQNSDQSIINKSGGGDWFNYNTVIQYLDRKRDRDTLKAVLTKVTSVNFVTKLANVQDKRSFQRSKGLVDQNLELYKAFHHGCQEGGRNSKQTDQVSTSEKNLCTQKA